MQVPAFETKDGKCIYESNAIAYYGMFLYVRPYCHIFTLSYSNKCPLLREEK